MTGRDYEHITVTGTDEVGPLLGEIPDSTLDTFDEAGLDAVGFASAATIDDGCCEAPRPRRLRAAHGGGE
jgi:hypothetical protein